MYVYYVAADIPKELNCSLWLCENPARALRFLGHTATVVALDEFLRTQAYRTPACLKADMVVIERNLFGETLAAIGYLRSAGVPVVVTFDDALDLVQPTNTAYNFWRLGLVNGRDGKPVVKAGLPPLVEFEYGLRAATAATMPSRLLQARWANHTRTHYLPNFIDTRLYLDGLAQRPARDGLTIGWGGSTSHLPSFTGSGILTALYRVCQARPNVRVVICGDNERIFNQLPVKNKTLLPWVPLADWPRQLAAFDIGLAPLCGQFDDHRSRLKVMEYLTMAIPFVASKSPAYAEFYLRESDPVLFPAFVDNTPEAWELRLMEVIDNYDAHYGAAIELQPLALKQDLFLQAHTIVATYERILIL